MSFPALPGHNQPKNDKALCRKAALPVVNRDKNKVGHLRMSSAAATLDVFLNRLSEVSTPFSIELPSGEKRKVGLGEEEFRVGLRNERALKALRTLDEGDIAEAYLQGDIDLEGDMLKPFALRASSRVTLPGVHKIACSGRKVSSSSPVT